MPTFVTVPSTPRRPADTLTALFAATGKLLCAGLIAYSGLTVEQSAARGAHHRHAGSAAHHQRRHTQRHKHRHDVAASSNDPAFCAASKAEAEAGAIRDRAVTVQALKNRAQRAHMSICEAARHGFAPGPPASETAWEAAKNVLYGAGDLVPAAFKNVIQFRAPHVPVVRGLRLKGSVVPGGNVYYAPK